MKRTAIIGAFGGALLGVSAIAQAHVNVDIGIGVPGVVYDLCGPARVCCTAARLRSPPGGRGSCARLRPLLAGTR